MTDDGRRPSTNLVGVRRRDMALGKRMALSPRRLAPHTAVQDKTDR
ncbi:MAG: hypothetical protein GY796_26900 [Chloroflexi bacterium]|nr:hypothetical protein [Chloroflexota bacterium]